MAAVFDGKHLADNIKKSLAKKVEELKKKGKVPKLVSVLVGDDPASKLYLRLKKSAAEEIGAIVEIVSFGENGRLKTIIEVIEKLNKDDSVDGIMVQLPLPEKFKKIQRQKIINSIRDEKDVDGMKKGSEFVAPVVMATLTALRASGEVANFKENTKIVVVGAGGFVGGMVFRVLEEMGYSVDGVDSDKEKDFERKVKKADVLIAATGQPGLIKKDMVKQGAVVIDIGSPSGDVDSAVEKKTSFFTPVPGGIGPLTVAYLLLNLVEASS